MTAEAASEAVRPRQTARVGRAAAPDPAAAEAVRVADDGAPIRTLTVTSLYPSVSQPRHGIFTEHRITSVVATGRVRTRVVAPVPWAPPGLRRVRRYRAYALSPDAATRRDLEVVYPRYLSIPKIGTALQPVFMFLALWRTSARLRREQAFDVIDSYYIYPDGVAAALLGAFLRKPVVLTAYGTDVNLMPRYPLARRMIRWACRRARAVTTVCGALRDSLVDLGVDSDKVRVIFHGVDLHLFKPSGQRGAARDRLGFRGRTLLSVGHLIERKGHHIAIDALEHLPGCTLVIVGDGEMESDLRRQVAQKGLADRVRFVGHVEQRDLPPYFEAADALVLASSREGVANVLVESMACGTPVVATDVWGTRELLTSDVCGRLVPDRTPESLADGVRSLFAAVPDRRAVRRFAEGFTWTDTAAEHIKVLDAVVDASPADTRADAARTG